MIQNILDKKKKYNQIQRGGAPSTAIIVVLIVLPIIVLAIFGGLAFFLKPWKR